ncbi:MAG: FHA domain-containing protein [Pirellulaceae bacterium]|nr:FHA domain-containing protein [Pirellulaceae bacterium]
MQVRLKVLKGTKTGKEVQLPLGVCLVGRGKECHLRSQMDAISNRHCMITTSESEVIVRDLESLNGTYVNGERVASEAVLRGGDQLRIGPLVFEVVIESAKALVPTVRHLPNVVPGTAGGNANLSTLIVGSSKRSGTSAAIAVLGSESLSPDSPLVGEKGRPVLESGQAVVISGGILQGATGSVVKRLAQGQYLISLAGNDGQVWVKMPAHLLRAT